MSFLKNGSAIKKIIAVALIIVFATQQIYAQSDIFSKNSAVVCAEDANHNGIIEQNEYAECEGYYKCPIPDLSCNENNQCVLEEEPKCPPDTALRKDIDLCATDPEISCPEGYRYDEVLKKCIAEVLCPESGSYDPHADECIVQVNASCPDGYTFNHDRKQCERDPECSAPGIFNPALDACVLDADEKCPEGFTKNERTGLCETPMNCPGEGWIKDNKCVVHIYPSCPEPYSYDHSTGDCTATPECPPPGYFSHGCQAQLQTGCPEGFTENPNYNDCEATPDCPSGGSYDSASGQCLSEPEFICDDGMTYDANIGKCVKQPDCGQGQLDEGKDVCVIAVNTSCPDGWTLNPGTGRCEKDPYCPPPSTYSQTASVCVIDDQIKCPDGYQYNPSTDRCEIQPTCPSGGTWNAQLKRCETPATSNWTCSLNNQSYATYDECESACISTQTATIFWTCSLNGQTYSSENECKNGCKSGGSTECRYQANASGQCDFCVIDFGDCPTFYFPRYEFGIWDRPGFFSDSSSVEVDNCKYYPGSYRGSFTFWCPISRKGRTTYTAKTAYMYEICRTCTTQGNCTEGHSCPSGYTYNGSECVLDGTCSEENQCPSGYTYNGSTCVSNPTCSYGSYDAQKGVCYVAVQHDCPAGYTYDSMLGMCVKQPICTPGTLEGQVCTLAVQKSCPSGWTLDQVQDICIKQPDCGNYTYMPDHDVCVDEAEKNCTQPYQYDQSSGKCTAQPSCSEGTYDSSRHACVEQISSGCPEGYELDRWGRCVTSPVCPEGGHYNWRDEKCHLQPAYNCPEGYTYSSENNRCEADVQCPEGSSMDFQHKKCYVSIAHECSGDYTYDSSISMCRADVTCLAPGSYDSAIKKCVVQVGVSCPDGYQYNSERKRCEAEPVCSTGTYNASWKRCVSDLIQNGSWTCPVNYHIYSSKSECESNCRENRFCYEVTTEQTKWKCSLTGSIFDSNQDCLANCKQQKSATCIETHTCPNYWHYDKDLNKCYTGPDCPSYGYQGTETGSLISGKCYTWEYCKYYCSYGSGYYEYAAPDGSRCDSWHKGCRLVGKECPQGYSWAPDPYQPGKTTCAADPTCPSGSEFDSSTGRCLTDPSEHGWKCTENEVVYESKDKCQENCHTTETGTCSSQQVSVPTGKWRCPVDNSVFDSESECEKSCVSYESCINGVCPDGFSYSGGQQCYRWPECPSGGIFDYWAGVCYTQPSLDICPSSYTYSDGICHHSPECPEPGSLDVTLDLCIAEASVDCPEGTTYNHTYGLCVAIPICENGDYIPDDDVCRLVMDCSQEYKCPLPHGGECRELVLEDSPDAANQFETHEGDKGFYDEDGEVTEEGCNGQVYIFNGYPMECLTAGIQTGFHNCCSGDCDGRIDNYIKQETESYGTLISNTMAYKAIKAAIYAYQAYKAYEAAKVVNEHVIKYFKKSSAIAGAPANTLEQEAEELAAAMSGKTTKTAVDSILTMNGVKNMIFAAGKAYLYSMALDFATDLAFKAFFGGCSAQDELTVCYKNHGLCHYVGSYCKESWPMVGCVQRAKVYCCFNSKLARIVHEKGRPQLKTFGKSKKAMWGDPEDSPNCRGFTPQEFQMLDFSRIDLSEWYHDMSVKAQNQIQQNLEQKVQKFKNNLRSR